MKGIIRATTKIEPNELKATVLSFLFVFTLMAAYFILRPVRDALSSDWTDAELSWLWTSTFFFSLVAVSVYGAVISRVQFKNLVPGVYGFFSLSFFIFFFGSTFVDDPVFIDKSFYVWLSVFSLFHVSVFWSFMSDLFSRNQAPRLFGIIATGASAGAIVGPTIPTFFADTLGATNLMPIAAVMLLIPIVIIRELEKIKVSELGNEDAQADISTQQAIGKNPFAGFDLFFKSRYLLGIGVFILCYVAISTFVYFEIKNLLVDVDRDVRTQIWAPPARRTRPDPWTCRKNASAALSTQTSSRPRPASAPPSIPPRAANGWRRPSRTTPAMRWRASCLRKRPSSTVTSSGGRR